MNLSMNIPIPIYFITYNITQINNLWLINYNSSSNDFPQESPLHAVVLYFWLYHSVILIKKSKTAKHQVFSFLIKKSLKFNCFPFLTRWQLNPASEYSVQIHMNNRWYTCLQSCDYIAWRHFINSALLLLDLPPK